MIHKASTNVFTKYKKKRFYFTLSSRSYNSPTTQSFKMKNQYIFTLQNNIIMQEILRIYRLRFNAINNCNCSKCSLYLENIQKIQLTFISRDKWQPYRASICCNRSITRSRRRFNSYSPTTSGCAECFSLYRKAAILRQCNGIVQFNVL